MGLIRLNIGHVGSEEKNNQLVLSGFGKWAINHLEWYDYA